MMRIFRIIAVSAALAAGLILISCEELTPLGDLIQESLQLEPPTMDAPLADANGYSNTDIVITLNHDDPTVDLYYSTDRSDPGSGGTFYTGPFTISGHNIPLLVKALARKDRQLDSDVIESEFLILYNAAEAPVLTPGGNSYNTAISVDMSSGSGGAAVWYTVDGTDPRGSATRILYDGSTFDIADDGTPDGSRIVINAVAQVDGLPDSPIVTEEYIVLYDTLSMPVLSPVTAQSEDPFDVTMTSPDGAEIWYTVDGTTPVSGSGSSASPSSSAQLYTGPLAVDWSGYDSRTIKAACFAEEKRPSAVQFGSYFRQIGQTPQPAVEVYDPGVGTAIAAIGGTIYTNANEPEARIASPPAGTRYFYTTDGTMPMISIDGSTIDILTAATQELSGTASLPAAESSYDLNLIAVSPGSDPSQLVTVPITVDRTLPNAPGLTPSGLTLNYYINADRYADDAWSVGLSGGGGGNGTFEWRWSGSGTSEQTASTVLAGATLIAAIPAGQGVKNLLARERDNAGNWSEWGLLNLRVDTVAPTISSSNLPANLSIGQSLSTAGEFSVTFSEPMTPASVDMRIGYYGGSEIYALTSFSGATYELNVTSGLNLDAEYIFTFAGATDLAGNSYAGSAITRRFVTGALFWSAGNVIYRAPITAWTDYGVRTWYTGPAGSTITDIEVGDGLVFWSWVDIGGEGGLRRSPSKSATSSIIYTIPEPSSGTIDDVEIDTTNDRVYFTAPDDAANWTIRYRSYDGVPGDGVEIGASPANLAWDGSTYYWTNTMFYHFYSDTLAYEPGVMGLNFPKAVGLEYRLNGSNREFYGMIDFEGGGATSPATANASSYVAKTVLNSGMTAELSTDISAYLNTNDLWGNGTDYGGDIELVETGGVSRIFVIAPTITGTASEAASNEYCAVFSMDFNLGDIRTHYNPYSLSLNRSLGGALAIDTE